MTLFEQFVIDLTPWSRSDLFEASEIIRIHVKNTGGNEDDLIHANKCFSETLNNFADDKSCVHIIRFAKYFVNTIYKKQQQASHE